MRGFFLQMSIWLVFMGTCFAQEDSIPAVKKINFDRQTLAPVEFEDETISKYQQDEAFDYVEHPVSENWWTLFKDWVSKQWNQFLDWLLGSYRTKGIIAFFIQILPYLVLAGILGFIIWLFIKLNPGASVLAEKKQPGVLLSDDEKIIRKKDISALISKAKQEKNYRLAVRYYYLLILKKLRDENLIDYQFQKTNEEYLSEITAPSLKKQFQSITHIYDFIWYGDFPIDETGFEEAEKNFKQMQTALNTSSLGKTL